MNWLLVRTYAMGTLFEEQLYICAPGGGAAAVPAVARVGSGKSAGPDNGSRTGCTVVVNWVKLARILR